MNCPKCDSVRLIEVVRKTVHTDICPNCKGVWLDRGELERILQDHLKEGRDMDWKDGDRTKEKKKEKSGNPLLEALGDIFYFI